MAFKEPGGSLPPLHKLFIKASKDIGLEVNSEKTKYMITSRHQNIIQNQTIVIGNLSFENVQNIKCLGGTITNTNGILEEIKCAINIGNECYYSLRKCYRPVCFPRNWKLIQIKLLYYRLYCRILKLGLLPWERSRD